MALKYQEVAKDLAHKIFNKTYTDKLPSEGELLKEYEVSRNTIRNALGILYNQGLIKRIQGSGYFITQPLHNNTTIMNMANKSGHNQIGNPLFVYSKVLHLEVIPANEEIAKDVAMHAAAMRPLYLKSSEVPTDVLEKEKTIIREQLINEGKPEDKIENILVGKVRKYYEEVCLEDQIYVKAENKETVSKFVQNNGGKVINMIRYEVGEGMEKKEVFRLSKEWIELKNGQVVERVKSLFFKNEEDAEKVCLMLRNQQESMVNKNSPCYFVEREALSNEMLERYIKAGKYFQSFIEYENHCLFNCSNQNEFSTIEDSMVRSF